MAKTRPGKRYLDFYTIRGTDKVVRAGDCVLMKSSEPDKQPYVARVEKIEADTGGNVIVKSANTIEGKCIVHSFKDYTKLEDVGVEDYYSRFEYKAGTKEFTPDRVTVYCKCEMPYNPNDLMIQCDDCKDWFKCWIIKKISFMNTKGVKNDIYGYLIAFDTLKYRFSFKTLTQDSPDLRASPKLDVAQGPDLGLLGPKLKVHGSPVFLGRKHPNLN
ncbi:hypothetical protein AgCh_032198 [Apium graveolens]